MSDIKEFAGGADAPLAAQPLQPTLFIALGGTGMKILMRLRRRILETRWNGVRLSSLADFPLAQFIYFDVDAQKARQENLDATKDLLGEVVSFSTPETLQEKLDVKRFLDNRSVYPLIDAWFPNDDSIRHMDFTDGAAQIRAVSRLQFFLKASAFRTLVQQKTAQIRNSLTHEEVLRTLGLAAETGRYRVVVIASAAGGTGSGTFLDTGFLLRSLGDRELANVSLILMLAGAYRDNGEVRVQANTVAALRELEFCMDRAHTPRYVTRWTSNDNPVGDHVTPYDSVSLIDDTNIAHESTGNASDLYDMIASALFSDFCSPELAQIRRSNASNIGGQSLRAYLPPLPGGLEGALTFQKAYSSFGHASIETHATRTFNQKTFELALKMLEDFYSLGEARKANAVSDDDLRNFIVNRLFLKERGIKFCDDPEIAKYYTMPPQGLPPSAPTFDLVDRLLTGGEKSPLRGIDDRVEEVFNRIRLHADFSQWPEQIAQAVASLDADVIGTVGVQDSSPRAKEIDVAVQRIWEGWTGSGPDGIAALAYSLIEDKNKGGLHYTLDLLQQVRQRLIEPGAGLVTRLNEAATAFDKWANALHQAVDRRPVANLKELKGQHGRSLGETILLHNVKPAIALYSRYRVIALAFRTAAARLKRFADEVLGIQESFGANVVWSGLIGAIDGGRDRLAGLSTELSKEIALIKQQDGNKTHWFIGNSDAVRQTTVAPEQLAEIARDVFEGKFGGTRTLFEKLATNQGKLEVREALRHAVLDALDGEIRRLPTIIDVLANDKAEASRQLQMLMKRAAPWINADTATMHGFQPDQVKYYLVVPDMKRFRAEFGAALASIAPNGRAPELIPSGLSRQIICYGELTGVPLDIITPLRTTWPISFRSERDTSRKPPLFTDRNTLLFRSPLVPNEAEYKRMSANAAVYLKGIVFGLLVRGSERRSSPDLAASYFYQSQPGSWLGCGNEQAILADEIDALAGKIGAVLKQAEAGLDKTHWAALYVLFQFYAKRVYPSHLFTDINGEQKEVSGFMSTVCSNIADEYRRRFLEVDGHGEGEDRFEALRVKLGAKLDTWTREVVGSRADLKEKLADESKQQPKRVILLDAVLAAASSGPGEPAAAVPAAKIPEAPKPQATAGATWRVAGPNRTQLGPFPQDHLATLVADGGLSKETLVWTKGMSAWTPAGQVEALASLWVADDEVPPLPDDDEPPPLI